MAQAHCIRMSVCRQGTVDCRPAAADVAVGAGLLVVKSFLAHGSSLRVRCAWFNSGLSHQALVSMAKFVVM